jgi:hypothetical protein
MWIVAGLVCLALAVACVASLTRDSWMDKTWYRVPVPMWLLATVWVTGMVAIYFKNGW